LDESEVSAVGVTRSFANVPEVGSAKQSVKSGISRIELNGLLELFLHLWDLTVVVPVIHLPEALDGGSAGIGRIVVPIVGPGKPGRDEQSQANEDRREDAGPQHTDGSAVK
jgi:hypothetical protein